MNKRERKKRRKKEKGKREKPSIGTDEERERVCAREELTRIPLRRIYLLTILFMSICGIP